MDRRGEEIKNDTTSKSTPSKSHSAAEVAGNNDLITEIFLRLPVKSVLRFKSVSKHWLSLISDPRFSRLHYLRNPTRTSGLLVDRNRRNLRYEFLNFDRLDSDYTKSPFKTQGLKVLQSCNGLLLCSTISTRRKIHHFVYNPSTNRVSSKLPPISGRFLGLSLAFDPSKSPYYKVICVRGYPDDGIFTYSPETGDWRSIDIAFHFEFSRFKLLNGVYWNGSVNWICNRGNYLLHFDVDKETVSSFPMSPDPYNYSSSRTFTYFGESRGHLHLVETMYNSKPWFNVHEMELDCSQWTLKFRISISPILSLFPRIEKLIPYGHRYFPGYSYSVLCVVRGNDSEEDGGSYLVLQIPGNVLRFNLNTEEFVKLCDGECSSQDDTESLELVKWADVHQFIESLSSV